MKKLLTVFGIALVAMVLASGCKKEDPWKDCDKKATEIKLTAGEWEAVDYSYMKTDVTKLNLSDPEMMMIGALVSGKTGTIAMESKKVLKFTVANDKVTVTEEKDSGFIDFPDSVDTDSIDGLVALAKLGDSTGEYSRSGSKLKYKTVSSAEEIEHDYPKETPVEYFTAYLEGKVNMSKLLTNEDGTKYRYYIEQTEGDSKYEIELTLAKD